MDGTGLTYPGKLPVRVKFKKLKKLLKKARHFFRDAGRELSGYSGESELRIFPVPQAPVILNAAAPVQDSINGVLGWLAQRAGEKKNPSDLRFIDKVSLKRVDLPWGQLPIAKPVRIQQARWFGSQPSVTPSVFFLFRRKVPLTTDDVALVVTGQRHMESVADAYERNGGIARLTDIVAEGGTAKLENLIMMYTGYDRPQVYLHTRPFVPLVSAGPKAP